MLNAEQMRERLKETNLKAAAVIMGVHFNTLYSVMKGNNPSYATAVKINEYLER